jgi:DNA-binding NtrC family response regulator
MNTAKAQTPHSEQSPPVILIADDDKNIRTLLDYNLKKNGYTTVLAEDGMQTLSLLSDDISVVLLDLQMPGTTGMECLRHIKTSFQDMQVIIITASSKVSDAVEALKAGAYDYLTKPLDMDMLIALLHKATLVSHLSTENRRLKQLLTDCRPQTAFLGASIPVKDLLSRCEKIADLDTTILITGESGVGKGLLARQIHYTGSRAGKPFVTVSCTSLPRELVETELFGHEKGSFTGAHQRRAGLLEIADGGTLFLDEIGDMPLELQPKLLSFLQERTFKRVGGNTSLSVDVRIMAATHQDLPALIKKQSFREDLFFRINVIPLHIPPLRDRPEDVELLADNFLGRIARKRGSAPFALSEDSLAALRAYAWPGNVRELENVLERTTVFSGSQSISAVDLPPELLAAPLRQRPETALLPKGIKLEKLERLAIKQTLIDCDGNKAMAARSLGISEKSIYNKLKRFGMA